MEEAPSTRAGSTASNLLVTGRPGAGKTTVIQAAMAALRGRTRAAGFTTEEVRRGGARTGFRIVTLDGRSAMLAEVGRRSGPRVGRYGVDLPSFERVALPALEAPDAAVFFVDEIGKMECLSARFRAAVSRLLDGPRPLVATVPLRASGFMAEVKRRRDRTIVEVTRENRDALPARITRWVLDRSEG